MWGQKPCAGAIACCRGVLPKKSIPWRQSESDDFCELRWREHVWHRTRRRNRRGLVIISGASCRVGEERYQAGRNCISVSHVGGGYAWVHGRGNRGHEAPRMTINAPNRAAETLTQNWDTRPGAATFSTAWRPASISSIPRLASRRTISGRLRPICKTAWRAHRQELNGTISATAAELNGAISTALCRGGGQHCRSAEPD